MLSIVLIGKEILNQENRLFAVNTHIPFREDVLDLSSTDPTKGMRPRLCRSYASNLATRTGSHI